jgi:transcriptional regulator with XRE-family HTH domain
MIKIKQQREFLNISIREAARQAGIAAPYWLDIERGQRNPSDEVLAKIARILNLDLNDLIKDKNEKSFHNSPEKPVSLQTRLSSKIIYLLAGGIIKSFSQFEARGKFPVPYPNDLQKAFDRIVLQCLLSSKNPPRTIVELLNWCEKPFGEWSVKPNPEKISLLDSLLSQGIPTYF